MSEDGARHLERTDKTAIGLLVWEQDDALCGCGQACVQEDLPRVSTHTSSSQAVQLWDGSLCESQRGVEYYCFLPRNMAGELLLRRLKSAVRGGRVQQRGRVRSPWEWVCRGLVQSVSVWAFGVWPGRAGSPRL